VCTDAPLTCHSVDEALEMATVALGYLTSPAAADLPGPACGDVLSALIGLQDQTAAAHATYLRRFDAADGHGADGYGSSSAWLAAKGRMTKRDARAVRPDLARKTSSGLACTRD
jgi:hypothetical protein